MNKRLKATRKKSGAELHAIEGAVKGRQGVPFIQPDSLPKGHTWRIWLVTFNLPERVLRRLDGNPSYQVSAPDPYSACGIACASVVPLLGAIPIIATVEDIGPAVIEVPTAALEALKEKLSPEMRKKISGLEERIQRPSELQSSPDQASKRPAFDAEDGPESRSKNPVPQPAKLPVPAAVPVDAPPTPLPVGGDVDDS